MYVGRHVQHPLFLSDFNETWIFLDRFSKYTKIYFMKIPIVEAELFQADIRTDRRDEDNSRFSQICERV
jgi:hypothetical protein